MVLRLLVASMVAALLAFTNCAGAEARALRSDVSEVAQIPALRPEYPVPREPNMLFYIQRSVNSNTVIYAARVDAQGRLDQSKPIEVYWRWYNVDGHRRPLNFFERMMAFGVNVDKRSGNAARIPFQVSALRERQLVLDKDNRGAPEALIQIGTHLARLVYVYLQVDDRGMMPDVTAIDIFGIDKLSGKALHEHVVRS